MSFQVEGTTALVTGANRGIGKAIVDALLSAGAERVYAAVRKPETMAEYAAASKGKVIPLALDLSDADSIVAAAREAADVKLVVNNAGVLRAAHPLTVDAFDALDYEVDVNVKGLLRMAQAFVPVLKQNGGGVFVQLNSVASLRNFADFSTYCASKAAAYSITQALRDVLADQGIRVLSVHPGPIATDMARDAGLEEMASPPSVVAEALLAAVAAGSFHCFPDPMAQNFWQGYQSFATSFVESAMAE